MNQPKKGPQTIAVVCGPQRKDPLCNQIRNYRYHPSRQDASLKPLLAQAQARLEFHKKLVGAYSTLHAALVKELCCSGDGYQNVEREKLQTG